MEKHWWMEAIGYQIYLKSFYDSNNDGVGDLNGIVLKLDYLKDLGVNLLWICPFYKSPMDDNGYDVSDFYQVDPLYGKIDDFRVLLQEAHLRGMKVITDLVLNHSSDEHPWFMEARKSLDNPYRDYYIWADGRINAEGVECEPTNWMSFFGGSAWQKDNLTNQYYMKIFSKKMPDLNWENEQLRHEIHKMAKWWLDLGVDGFRVDAVAHLSRAEFRDSTLHEGRYVADWSKFSNLPQNHTYIQEMNQKVFSQQDILTIGEVGGRATCYDALNYSGYNSHEFNMVFNFDHNWYFNEKGTDLVGLKQVFNKWQTGIYGKGWNPLYWYNHDHPRLINCYGHTGRYWKQSAKMLAAALYFMWGTPFIYNGEEIGMTNYPFEKVTDFADLAEMNRFKIAQSEGVTEKQFVERTKTKSRDNARTMMQWDTCPFAGFSEHQPWFHVNPNYKKINVASQESDQYSILAFYKRIIQLRQNSEYKDLITYGTYTLLAEEHPSVYMYTRQDDFKQLLIVTNFTNKIQTIAVPFIITKLILSNYIKMAEEIKSFKLRPYECRVYEVSKIV